jgi:hypothetical protein
VDARQGWQGAESELRLAGWGRARRVVVLRRPVKKDLAVLDPRNPRQMKLGFTEGCDDVAIYEYAVLVTSLDAETLTVA